MKSPRYTILIASRKTGVVRRLTLSRRLLASALVGACGLPLLIGMGAGGASVSELDDLRVANDTLKLENESYREATGELADQITSLQAALTQLGEQGTLDPATRAAISSLPKDVRMRAAGGPSNVSAPPVFLPSPTKTPEGTFGILRDLLGTIESRLTSVRSQIESQQALARATPAGWPIAGWLSSTYGYRKDPFTGLMDFHPALDIASERGKPVRATADATVESVGYLGNYGNQIQLNHGFGISTRYGHLSGFNVRMGQKVKRNEVIGYVGSTGRVTSPHLHYEILVNGSPINPWRLLRSR